VAFLVFLSVALYGLELRNGVGFITDLAQVGFVYGVLFVLLDTFALGLIRAWELLGVHRYGLLGWLNPLRDLNETESFSRAGNSHSAVEHPKADETVPRSASQ
jgi:hypothetical protein